MNPSTLEVDLGSSGGATLSHSVSFASNPDCNDGSDDGIDLEIKALGVSGIQVALSTDSTQVTVDTSPGLAEVGTYPIEIEVCISKFPMFC
jgi:hypothetical protein